MASKIKWTLNVRQIMLLRVIKNQKAYSPQALPTFVNSIGCPFFYFLGHKVYISCLNGCHIAWKMHSITFDFLNLTLVAISDSKDLYSASSSSVSTKRFIEHTSSPYNSKKLDGKWHEIPTFWLKE